MCELFNRSIRVTGLFGDHLVSTCCARTFSYAVQCCRVVIRNLRNSCLKLYYVETCVYNGSMLTMYSFLSEYQYASLLSTNSIMSDVNRALCQRGEGSVTDSWVSGFDAWSYFCGFLLVYTPRICPLSSSFYQCHTYTYPYALTLTDTHFVIDVRLQRTDLSQSTALVYCRRTRRQLRRACYSF